MKTSFTRISFTLFFLMMSINSLSGQAKGTLVFSKTIKLNGETEVKDIIMPLGIDIPLKESSISITITVISSIDEGELQINVYNPSGKGYGSFKIYGKNETKTIERLNNKGFKKIPSKNIDRSNENASGPMNVSIYHPMRGDWKAKITNKGAIGYFTILLVKVVY